MAKIMNGWVRWGAAGWLALAPSLAAAHNGAGPQPVPHRFGEFAVNNTFDGEAEVLLDGRCIGRVGGNDQDRFTARAGGHELVVKRPGTNYVLFARNIKVYEDQLIVLKVAAPMGTLRVANDGEVALRLDIDDADVWISPGSAVQVPVLTGNVEIDARMKDPRGEWLAMERTVWVEPGVAGVTTLRPEPTVIVVSNRENFAVHALFDGRDAGWIGAGESKRVWVRPGPTNVVVLDKAGHVRTTAQLTVSRGNEAKVIVQPAFRAVNTSVHSGPVAVRPGGPVRHDHDADCRH